MCIVRARLFHLLVMAALLTTTAGAATKVHVISFGKWTSGQWLPGGADDKPLVLKIRDWLSMGA
ncbi:MAG TPA: hypothetical protein VIX37_06080 [Candidatus Sulfotelmatobacter sp.]